MPRWRPVTYHPIKGRTILRSIIPGLAHLRNGHKLAGGALLGTWLAALLTSLLTIGGGFSQFCFTFACVVHSFAIIAILGENLGYERLPIRILAGLAVFSGVWWLAYRPVTWVATQLYQPLLIEGLTPTPVLTNGDVILYEGPWRRSGSFKRGDIVVYKVNAQAAGRGTYQFATLDGLGIDRIIGLPGERIQIESDRCLVNGAQVDQAVAPLARFPRLWTDGLDVELASGEYLIIPSTLNIPTAIGGQATPMFSQLARVAASNVMGRVVFRPRPFSKFGSLE